MCACLLTKENTFQSREPRKVITHLKWQGLTQGYIYIYTQKKPLLTNGVGESSLNPEKFPWGASPSQERGPALRRIDSKLVSSRSQFIP